MGERKAKAGARGGGARSKTLERTEIDLDAMGFDEDSRTKTSGSSLLDHEEIVVREGHHEPDHVSDLRTERAPF